MKYRSAIVFSALFLAACATTSIQPLTQDSFKVATNAAPACGPQGARNVAFQTAAIEVIRKGGDLFIIAGDSTNYDGWSGVSEQGMVVKMIDRKSGDASNALSAREILGANWQELVQKGAPTTCT
ncbi:hypothetical protein [Pseudogemmobacter sp. W21_MBD1_M6]|uniref:hypothetical protein n=1 Tax=Pseudogemmobacter sp. W21_MBD1_M6 TaxID=3240271 RepID=UPI003F947AD8